MGIAMYKAQTTASVGKPKYGTERGKENTCAKAAGSAAVWPQPCWASKEGQSHVQAGGDGESHGSSTWTRWIWWSASGNAREDAADGSGTGPLRQHRFSLCGRCRARPLRSQAAPTGYGLPLPPSNAARPAQRAHRTRDEGRAPCAGENSGCSPGN